MTASPSSAEDLAFASSRELAAHYAAKRVSPVEVAKVILARIEEWNKVLNAYCHLAPDVTLADARASEERWMRGLPLGCADGIPYGVKDLLHVKGCPIGFGSKAGRQHHPSEHDAPSVARLKEAGAIFVGKTITSEFGWKGTGDSPLYGLSPNAWDLKLTSGGSSGGAANAAAAGLGTFQLGTDGGGSVRIPAAFSGICGMKATFGRVAAWPAGPMLTSSHVGPMARTVKDVAALLTVVGRGDTRDWNSVRAPRDAQPPAERLDGLRIGLYLPTRVCEPAIEDTCKHVADILSGCGAHVEPVRLPFDDALELQQTHWHAGAAWLVSQIPEDQRSLVDPGLLESARLGERMSLPHYYSAMVRRQKFGEAMQQLVSSYDAVLTPTVPIFPFAVGREAPADAASQNWLEWNPFTYPLNLSRQPAVSIPAGFHTNGLPIGVQLIGSLHEDDRLISIASLIEDEMGVELRRPTRPGAI